MATSCPNDLCLKVYQIFKEGFSFDAGCRKPDVSSGRLPFCDRYFDANIFYSFIYFLIIIFFLLKQLMNLLTRG